jgi:hypothetical protein
MNELEKLIIILLVILSYFCFVFHLYFYIINFQAVVNTGNGIIGIIGDILCLVYHCQASIIVYCIFPTTTKKNR